MFTLESLFGKKKGNDKSFKMALHKFIGCIILTIFPLFLRLLSFVFFVNKRFPVIPFLKLRCPCSCVLLWKQRYTLQLYVYFILIQLFATQYNWHWLAMDRKFLICNISTNLTFFKTLYGTREDETHTALWESKTYGKIKPNLANSKGT